MTALNTVDKLYLGTATVAKVYLGATQVWPAVSAYDAATTAWINAVVAAGGTVSTPRKILVDDLIVGLKADGIWAKFDRLWIFAAENSKSALIDLVANSSATPSSGPTFTPDRGYTCNASAIVNTGFIPNTHGVQYTLNTAHASVWSLTSAQSAQYTALSGQTNIFTAYPDGNCYTRINNNGGGAGANSDGSGFFLGVRTAGSGASAIMGYRNGVNIVNTADGTLALDGSQWTVNDREIAATSVGGTMSGADSAKFYSRLRAYMTAVGILPLYDSSTYTWVDAVAAAGGSVSTSRQTLVNDLIVGLKADGVWAKLDRLWIFAAENAKSALIDLKALDPAVVAGSPTYTADRGVIATDSNNLQSNYNVATNAVNFVQNSAHIACWALNCVAQGQPLVTVAGYGSQHIFPSLSGTTYARINDSGSGVTAPAILDGLWLGNRTNSTSCQTYKDGVIFHDETLGSVAVGSAVFLPAFFGTCSAASIGGSFTSTQQLAFYNRLRTYMTAVGVP